MNPAERKPYSQPVASRKIEEAAAAWLARCYGGLSAEDAVGFEAWLAADPRNAAAIAELKQAWRVVSSPGAAGQGGVAQDRQRMRERFRARRRKQATAVAVGLAMAAVAAFVFPPARWFHSKPAPTARIVMRPDMQRLPDGSTVQLNAGAEIAPAFTPEKRLVWLVRGEALFAVAKDATRPFVVSAGGVEVRAVGTAFTVRYEPKQVDILVTEGTVAVERTASPATDPQASGKMTIPPVGPMHLTAGQSTVVLLNPEAAPPPVTRVTSEEIATTLAWRERRIEFTHTPLAEAVELFNRQNRIQLTVADADTGNFEISGIFWADDPESFVRLLESAFDVTSEHAGSKTVLRKR